MQCHGTARFGHRGPLHSKVAFSLRACEPATFPFSVLGGCLYRGGHKALTPVHPIYLFGWGLSSPSLLVVGSKRRSAGTGRSSQTATRCLLNPCSPGNPFCWLASLAKGNRPEAGAYLFTAPANEMRLTSCARSYSAGSPWKLSSCRNIAPVTQLLQAVLLYSGMLQRFCDFRYVFRLA